MAQHDGKPYQPRRGPERPPQPAEDPAAPADGVDHLAMVAAEAEAMVAAAAAAEAEEEPMNPFEEEPEPGLEKDDLSEPGLEKDDLSEPGLEKDDLSEPGLEKDDLSEPGVDMEEDELEEEEEEEEEEEMEEEEEDEAEGEGQHEHHGGNGEALPMDVEAAAAAAAAATAAGAPLDPHGTAGPATVHPTNQLTLSFQGEVYVFDSVSLDKVQAVLLLLGGRELNPGASPSTPYSKRLNYPHRVASLLRFREKRKERNFDKKIRYSVRKEVALRMQRKRGQFTSSKPRPDEATSELPTPDGSTNWASLEGRPPSAPECHHCGTNAKSTPMMRRGPDGPRTLCNACGLMWANKGMLRDIAKSSPSPRQVAVSAPNDGQNGNTV